ncbi:helix-turn-helix domain-containing protein (plasmid) [Pseudomonas sp. FeN3W]|nr:helix-turn-helix domain-containing protein [Pseudomonas sp. FeN3W]
MVNQSGSEFEAVVSRLGHLLKTSKDADIHRFLGMSQSSYSNRKKRGTIPYEEIIHACIRQGFSLDYVLAARDPYDTSRVAPISTDFAIGFMMNEGGTSERKAGKAFRGIYAHLVSDEGNLTHQRISDAVGAVNQVLCAQQEDQDSFPV